MFKIFQIPVGVLLALTLLPSVMTSLTASPDMTGEAQNNGYKHELFLCSDCDSCESYTEEESSDDKTQSSNKSQTSLKMANAQQAFQYSALWGENGDSWDPNGSQDPQDANYERLPNFTNVGYMNGDVAIPDWPIGVDVTAPEFGAIPNDGIDDAQAFIDAIAACPDNHAVFVPNGVYTIRQRIEMNNDYCVLRGENMYETILFFPKYLNEVEIQEVGFQNPDYNSSNGYRHTGTAKGFIRIPSGGTHRSIENLTFKFRGQRKMGHWEHKGASALHLSGVDSWVRNVVFIDGDHDFLMGGASRVSLINLIFDHTIDRPDILNGRTRVGHIAINGMGGNSQRLYHNIVFNGDYFHELDINGGSNSVASNFSGDHLILDHHSQGANNNLYTNVYVGGGEGTQGMANTQYNETHWRIWGDNPVLDQVKDSNRDKGHIFVGVDSPDAEIINEDKIWFETIDPDLLLPQNIYLAQLDKVGKPLPQGPPPPAPLPSGDLIRMYPAENRMTDSSSPDTVSGFEVGRDWYFKFDLKTINLNSVGYARFRFTATELRNTPVEFSIFAVDDDTWSNDTLTYNNAPPSAVTPLATVRFTENVLAEHFEFDVTSFVKNEFLNDPDKIVSLVLKRTGGDGSISFLHRPGDGYAPELAIAQIEDAVPGAPSAPSDVRVYPMVGNIKLDWPDNPESDIAYYNVYRSNSSTEKIYYEAPIGMGLVDSEFIDIQHLHDTGWDVGMLRHNTAYFYRVTAVDKSGKESESSLQAIGSAKSYLDLGDTQNQSPSFNANLTILANATQYVPYSGSLASSASDPEGDPIYFFKVNGPEWLSVAPDGTLSGTPRLGTTGIFNFTVQVSAHFGGRAETSVQITVDPGAPDTPLNLEAIPGDNNTALTWTHDSEGSANFTYSVYRSTSSGGPYTLIVDSLTTGTYTDVGLDNNTTYYYVVTASNTTGESPNSAEAFATPYPGLVIDTNFIGGGDLHEVDAWDNGLPQSPNRWGHISSSLEFDANVQLDGYNVIHTNGSISRRTGNGALRLTGGSKWITEGPNATIDGSLRGFNLSNSTFILEAGTVNSTGGRDWTLAGSSSIIVNGGTLDIGGSLDIVGGIFVVNDGVVTGRNSESIGSIRNSANLNINGGNVSVGSLSMPNSSILTLGGKRVGAITANNLSPFSDRASINFLPGSQVTLTVSAEDEWAAAKWESGNLTYNGQGVNRLGSWSEVTATDGLEPGVRFDYDSTTETLSLVSAASSPLGPTITFETPTTDSDAFDVGSDLYVRVNASVTEGSVSNVRLFLDGQFVRSESIAPYEWGAPDQNDTLLQEMPSGTYLLEVVATDNDGNENVASLEVVFGSGDSDSDGDGMSDEWELLHGLNPLSGEQRGYTGRYYNNMTLSGDPVLERIDETIDFDFGESSPEASVSTNRFSVGWEAYAYAENEVTGSISFTVDDGGRLYLNDVEILSGWTNQAPTTYTSGQLTFSAGHYHKIRFEYYENTGGAVAQLNLPAGLSLIFSEAEADFDEDGLSNLQEAVRGTDPTVVNDSDGDGILDLWETSYFGSLSGTNGALDSDNDGTKDFFEYLFGSNPTDASSRGFKLDIAPHPLTPDMVLSWTVDPSFVFGEDYFIRSSINLIDWPVLDESLYSVEDSIINDKRLIEVEINTDNEDRLFLILSSPSP